MKIACYQFNPCVGDIVGNLSTISSAIKSIKSLEVDLFFLPELAVTGYEMQDLFFRPEFKMQIDQYLDFFLEIKGMIIAVTIPVYENDKIFNSIVLVKNGKILARYDKFSLANYGLFNEKRYFSSSANIPNSLFHSINSQNSIKYSFLICEDLWVDSCYRNQILATNDLVLVANASPFTIDKHQARVNLLQDLARSYNTAIVYLNQSGGHDGLIFDGASFAVNSKGIISYQAPSFEYSLDVLLINKGLQQINIDADIFYQYPNQLESVYRALVVGLADYYSKNNFKKAIIGLSGGADSALSLMIAVDALGADNVLSLMLYSKYNSKDSLRYAKELTNNLQVKHLEIDIMPIFITMLRSLGWHSLEQIEQCSIKDNVLDISVQNIQARIRSNLLMWYSNQYQGLLLNTSNKSEIALGYGTIYGDLAGGYGVLQDVYKTMVYELINYRNCISKMIPQYIIDRPPSAELKNDQQDQDSIPPYSTLDQILKLLIEHNLSVQTVLERQEFDLSLVQNIAKTLFANQYKFQQLAVGTKISTTAFNREWRHSISKITTLIG